MNVGSGEVFVGEEGESIVKVGMGSTLGATAIITRLAVGATVFGPILEGLVNRLEDLVDD
jgi:hypothetical protein